MLERAQSFVLLCLILSLLHVLVFEPDYDPVRGFFREVFMRGPAQLGMQMGLAPEAFCERLTHIPSPHWRANAALCAERVEREFEAHYVIYRLALGALLVVLLLKDVSLNPCRREPVLVRLG